MHTFRVGRLFGIEVRVDWSWLLIFVLLTGNMVSVFSKIHPEWSSLERWLLAGLAALLFFGCILLHELAHSAMAKSYGLRVRSITLFLFGGMSDIEREPPSPRVEFFTAIAGPAASLLLGAALLWLESRTVGVAMNGAEDPWTGAARLGPLSTLLAWLGFVNVAVGAFNLIPGFPLDGGRVFRSFLWRATGDLHTATRWASISGQCVGWLFIAGGIAMTFGVRLVFFGTGLGSGIWLAFVGWFLQGGAASARTKLALDDALAGMTVEQLMQRQGPKATPDVSVATLVHDHVVAGDDRALPVVEHGRFLGLVSIADVRKVRPEVWATTRVGDIMRGVEALKVAAPGEPLAQAYGRIAHHDIDQIPVVTDGYLVGMLRRRDVTRWIERAWKRPLGDRSLLRPKRDERIALLEAK